MNDVNMAPGNQGNPIKGATQGVDTQALGGGKVAGMSLPAFITFSSLHHANLLCIPFGVSLESYDRLLEICSSSEHAQNPLTAFSLPFRPGSGMTER